MEQAHLAYLPVRLYEVRMQAMESAVEALDEQLDVLQQRLLCGRPRALPRQFLRRLLLEVPPLGAR